MAAFARRVFVDAVSHAFSRQHAARLSPDSTLHPPVSPLPLPISQTDTHMRAYSFHNNNSTTSYQLTT